MIPALLAAGGVLVLAGFPAPSRLAGLRPVAARTGALSWWWGPSLAAVALMLLSGPAAAVGGAFAVLLGYRSWRRRQEASAREVERAGAAEALAVLVAELRAGQQPGRALAAAAEVAVGPFAATLLVAARSAQVGADPAECLVNEAEASAVPQLLKGLAACWTVCASTGSSLAAAVEVLAQGLRAQHEQHLALEAELAGPRATAVMLAALPLAGLSLAAGLGARPLHVLLHTPVGLGCLAAGVSLDLVGLWWTRWLVSRAGGNR